MMSILIQAESAVELISTGFASAASTIAMAAIRLMMTASCTSWMRHVLPIFL